MSARWMVSTLSVGFLGVLVARVAQAEQIVADGDVGRVSPGALSVIHAHVSEPCQAGIARACTAHSADERGYPWAEVPYGGSVARDDIEGEGYDVEQPIVGVLVYLSQFGFVGGTDIADALEWLSTSPGCRRRRPRRGVMRVLRIIERLE